MAISERDLRSIVGFLHRAAEEADSKPFSPAMLRDLGTLIAADLVEYFEIRQADRSGVAYESSGAQLASAGVVDAWEAYRHQNPIAAFRWLPADGALRLSSVIGRRRLRGLGWHREYLEPSRIRDQLKLWLWRTPETAVCVSFDRSDGEFSDRDAAVLEVLQPHLLALHRSRQADTAVGPIDAGHRSAELTRREAQVLVCAIAGRENRAIADTFVISPATVRKHLEHAYQKLGVRNRTEAAAMLLGLSGDHDQPRGR